MVGLESELTQGLEQRIIKHKQNFIKLFTSRYLEILPSLITYETLSDNRIPVNVNFTKVEHALRTGHEVVIGETTEGNIQLLGWVNSKNTESNPSLFLQQEELSADDVNYIVPPYLIKKDGKEISYKDNYQTGNFVVLRNKSINYIKDHEVIKYYVNELAEIVVSRYSLTMQTKLNTLFLSDVNDESMNQLVSRIYNGAPFIKVSDVFDPDEQIYKFNNESVAQNFQELKREYQNKISELNTMLGINSLAVEKSSGVSDEEAKSNRGYTTSNANIYLDARNEPLLKLNTRYGLSLKAVYNDEVASELGKIIYTEEEEGDEYE